jgi:glycolate oxidase iron-sulfur subunit
LQDACHLAHAQRIRVQPRALLRKIPGLRLVEMAGSDRCCGAAGVYSLTQPAMSRRILDEKLECIAATRATTVVVTNPGCHMQLLAGCRERLPHIKVRHLVELLDEAYGAAADQNASTSGLATPDRRAT